MSKSDFQTSECVVNCTVNGEPQTLHAHPLARLLDVLREELGLTGTKEGCGEGECGACAVLIDGEIVNSCLVPVAQVEGARITTIEGITTQHDDQLHAVQQAFIECGGAQCGICTPGMILAAVNLLERTPQPTEADIRAGLAGNLCRCTGYTKIFESVVYACRSFNDQSMRAYLPNYELRVPRDADEALALLADEPGVWRPFAGGTDLMVLLEANKLAHRKFFSIRHLGELRGIDVAPEHVTLGALSTYTDIQRNATMQAEFPMLCQAAFETGGLAIQNRGTLGGNIANASPAADSPPSLLVYDARLELVSTRGARWVAYKDFHTAYKQTIMRPDELIARIRLPRAAAERWTQYARKVGTRRAQAISKICFAGVARMEGERIEDVRMAFGSVAPTVVRCVRTEALLQGRTLDAATVAAARAELAREIVPIDDIRSTAVYRLRVAANLLEEFLWRLPSV